VFNPPPAPDPAELLLRFRSTYRNFHSLSEQTGTQATGVTIETPAAHPLSEDGLPEGIRRLLERYRKEHPAEKLELLKYMRVVNGAPELVVEDELDLPPAEELMTLSQTVTLNTSEQVHVITDLFVARRA
jgi:hypothetical protein